jgi:acetyl esterase
MSLDPQAEAYLEMVAEIRKDAPPISEIRPEHLRAWSQLVKSKAQVSLDPVQNAQDHIITGAHRNFSIRSYQPFDSIGAGVAIYFHGGGFVTGSVDLRDNLCRSLANRSRWTIVSVEYSLSPEAKYPTALDEGQLALDWVRAFHKESPIVLMGDSAGATIASVLSHRNRDCVKAQVLIYPWLDLEMTSRSIDKYEGIILTRSSLNWFADQYLPEGVSRRDPSVSPYYERDLTKVPDTFILVAECDPLSDEGESYASRLKESGTKVRVEKYLGMVHGFIDCNKFIDQSQNAIDDICEYLKSYSPSMNLDIANSREH